MPKVYVIDMGRKFYYLQWDDPETGKRITRSSKQTTKRGAERAAIDKERELSLGEFAPRESASWDSFTSAFAEQHLASLALRSEEKALGVLKIYADEMRPRTANDLTTPALSNYAAKMRDKGRSEATIASHFTVLSTAMNWGKEHGYLGVKPKIPRLARNPAGRLRRGRAITPMEFTRMLRAIRDVIERPARRSWRHYLRGLWLSGLRLKESLELSWDDPGRMRIVTDGPHPMFAIVGEGEKGFRDRRLPMTPDFAQFILRTPADQRTGFVFNPIGDRGGVVRGDDYIGKVITRIGTEAGVIVNHRGKKKHASAHDLRRSFGTRWARRVMPQVLKELMRHEDVSTTMRYYVDLAADETAADLWRNFGGQHNGQQ